MIKLQDLAAQYKVTDRAIQKHLKNHEKELEGHFERKGPNGTWLDEYACNYIKELMRIQTVVTSDDPELQNRIKELELELEKVKGAAATIKQMYDDEHKELLEVIKNQVLLEEKSKNYDGEKKRADNLYLENLELKLKLENEQKKTWIDKLLRR